MLKRSFKYLSVLFLNTGLLTILLAIWTDDYEMITNWGIRPLEFLKILAFNTAALLGIRILITYFRKKNITNTRSRIKAAALLTLLLSSYLYITYTSKIINNRWVNGAIRKQIAAKIQPTGNGSEGEGLTSREYAEIRKKNNFPALPIEAENISYSYWYEGFLPDYAFTLKYDLPAEVYVDEIDYKKGEFLRIQQVKTEGNKKRVTYEEILQ